MITLAIALRKLMRESLAGITAGLAAIWLAGRPVASQVDGWQCPGSVAGAAASSAVHAS